MHLTNLVLLLVSVLPTLITALSWGSDNECPTQILATVPEGIACEYTCDYNDNDNVGKRCSCKSPIESSIDSIEAVHNVLISCPNITSLYLVFLGGDCTHGPGLLYFPFDPVGGETFPRLESIKLVGYQFHPDVRDPRDFSHSEWMYSLEGSKRNPSSIWNGAKRYYYAWAQQQSLLRNQRGKSNLDLWLDAMDWSAVKNLTIIKSEITPEVVSKLPQKLSSLRQLNLAHLPFILALPKNSLTHLTWIGPSVPTDLPAILAHHGDSLQYLDFRCPEITCPQFIPSYEMSIIPKKAPNLTHLTIDVPRNGTWPFDSLAVLSSMSKIRSLDLYMNIQSLCGQQYPSTNSLEHRRVPKEQREACEKENRYQKPLVDEVGALEMFAYMRRKKEGVELQNTTFWVGDWSHTQPSMWAHQEWIEDRKSKVVCGLEDGEEQCRVARGKIYWEGYRDWDDEDYFGDEW